MHIYLCGQIGIHSYYGDIHFIFFVDDYSRMMIVMSMKVKSDAFDMFKWYKARVEKETSKSLKCLRFNRGDSYVC